MKKVKEKKKRKQVYSGCFYPDEIEALTANALIWFDGDAAGEVTYSTKPALVSVESVDSGMVDITFSASKKIHRKQLVAYLRGFAHGCAARENNEHRNPPAILRTEADAELDAINADNEALAAIASKPSSKPVDVNLLPRRKGPETSPYGRMDAPPKKGRKPPKEMTDPRLQEGRFVGED